MFTVKVDQAVRPLPSKSLNIRILVGPEKSTFKFNQKSVLETSGVVLKIE